MAAKKSSDKNQSITNERQVNFLQKYNFDPLKYQEYFEVNTDMIQAKLVDGLWPFIPENQHYLINKKDDVESVRQFKVKPNTELYGPIWILLTLIVQFCILSHL